MADENLTAKIEDWLLGKLPPSEAAAFQAQVDADAVLAEEVELHRLTLRAMQTLSEQDLQQKVLTWLDEKPLVHQPETKPTGPPRNLPKWPWLALALLVLAIAGAFGVRSWVALNNQQKQSEIDALKEQLRSIQQGANQQTALPDSNLLILDSLQKENLKLLNKARELEKQLNAGANSDAPQRAPIATLDEYYSLPTWTGGVRSETSTGATHNNLVEALEAFNARDFSKTAEKARQTIAVEPGNTAAVRLMAHALINQGSYIEAIEAFKKLRATILYEDEADWNIMLCHWKLSKVDTGQRQFFVTAVKNMAKSQNPKYVDKAKDLMKAEKVK